MIGSKFRANRYVRVLTEVGKVQRLSEDRRSIYVGGGLRKSGNTGIISRHGGRGARHMPK
jgi:hypothetical protein